MTKLLHAIGIISFLGAVAGLYYGFIAGSPLMAVTLPAGAVTSGAAAYALGDIHEHTRVVRRITEEQIAEDGA